MAELLTTPVIPRHRLLRLYGDPRPKYFLASLPSVSILASVSSQCRLLVIPPQTSLFSSLADLMKSRVPIFAARVFETIVDVVTVAVTVTIKSRRTKSRRVVKRFSILIALRTHASQRVITPTSQLQRLLPWRRFRCTVIGQMYSRLLVET